MSELTGKELISKKLWMFAVGVICFGIGMAVHSVVAAPPKPKPIIVTVASRLALCDSTIQALRVRMNQLSVPKTKQDSIALSEANGNYVWWQGARAMYDNLAETEVRVKQ